MALKLRASHPAHLPACSYGSRTHQPLVQALVTWTVVRDQYGTPVNSFLTHHAFSHPILYVQDVHGRVNEASTACHRSLTRCDALWGLQSARSAPLDHRYSTTRARTQIASG